MQFMLVIHLGKSLLMLILLFLDLGLPCNFVLSTQTRILSLLVLLCFSR